MTSRSKKNDQYLEDAKREQQEIDRALVISGKRTQESMYFIPREIAKKLKIRHRSTEY